MGIPTDGMNITSSPRLYECTNKCNIYMQVVYKIKANQCNLNL